MAIQSRPVSNSAHRINNKSDIDAIVRSMMKAFWLLQAARQLSRLVRPVIYSIAHMMHAPFLSFLSHQRFQTGHRMQQTNSPSGLRCRLLATGQHTRDPVPFAPVYSHRTRSVHGVQYDRLINENKLRQNLGVVT